MKFFYTFFFFLFASVLLHAQNIKVLNSVTKEPIFGVAIYNVDKSKCVVTNFLGEASLNEFSTTEIIYFKHLSHVLKEITKLRLAGSNRVYLESNTQGLEEIVISASKFEQSKRDIPQKIISINAENVSVCKPANQCRFTGKYRASLYSKKSVRWWKPHD